MAKSKTSHSVYEGNTSDLQFDDKNFNKHTKRGMELLGQSIERNGFGRSVLVDKNNRLVAGNGITEQAIKQGKQKTIVVETDGDELVVVKRNDLDLNSKKGRDMALADNAVAAIDLDFDEDMLREVESSFDDFDVSDWGLDLQDYDDSPESEETVMPSSAESTTATSVKEDDYQPVSFEKIPTVVARGDVWELGHHRLICGDPNDRETWEKLMGKSESAMLFIDTLPLGVLMPDYIDGVVARSADAMRAGAGVYVWHDFKETGVVHHAINAAGLTASQDVVWVKDKATDTKPDFKLRHESCVYGWKGRTHSWRGGTTPSSVLEFATGEQIEGVPDMKPIRLIAYLMECSTKEGDVVTDPFGQLGATLIAAEQIGRKAYICEVNPMKCNVIIDRYIKFTNNPDHVYQVDGTDLIRYNDVV